jgi:hypothetical protein
MAAADPAPPAVVAAEESCKEHEAATRVFNALVDRDDDLLLLERAGTHDGEAEIVSVLYRLLLKMISGDADNESAYLTLTQCGWWWFLFVGHPTFGSGAEPIDKVASRAIELWFGRPAGSLASGEVGALVRETLKGERAVPEDKDAALEVTLHRALMVTGLATWATEKQGALYAALPAVTAASGRRYSARWARCSAESMRASPWRTCRSTIWPSGVSTRSGGCFRPGPTTRSARPWAPRPRPTPPNRCSCACGPPSIARCRRGRRRRSYANGLPRSASVACAVR